MEILKKYYSILARTKIGGVKVREEGKKNPSFHQGKKEAMENFNCFKYPTLFT